jgi:Zn-dependent protease with chaperone function
MQLILIVQVSIALLASEIAGSLPVSAAAGALGLAVAPLGVLAHGLLLAWLAQRGMDRGSRRGVERLYASSGRVGWAVCLMLAIAAGSALPDAIAPVIGQAGVAILLLAVGIASTLLVYATTWPIEKRLRESSFMRALDGTTPVHPMPSRGAYVLAQARAGLVPMLAPLLVPILLSEMARQVALAIAPELAEQARLAGGMAGALLLFVLVPLLVPPLLGLRRLSEGELRDDLASLARDAGVGVREIWVWPTDGLIANAAVMGVLPGLRCVMLSDCLLEGMPRPYVRAVMAHELGHVVHRHLAWMLVIVLGCWTVASGLVTPVAQSLAEEYARSNADVPESTVVQVASLARDAGMLAIGLLFFGFASRRIERQADTYAVELLSRRAASASATADSVDAMVGALGAVAVLNHVPPERPSWRHGSIAWRQEYLRALVGAPNPGGAINAFVAALRWGALAVVVAGLVLGIFPF